MTFPKEVFISRCLMFPLALAVIGCWAIVLFKEYILRFMISFQSNSSDVLEKTGRSLGFYTGNLFGMLVLSFIGFLALFSVAERPITRPLAFFGVVAMIPLLDHSISSGHTPTNVAFAALISATITTAIVAFLALRNPASAASQGISSVFS